METSTSIYAVDGMDSFAMHVAHSMQVNFKRPMHTLCGTDKRLRSDMVPLLSIGTLNYKYGYFLELDPDSPEWKIVVASHEWLEAATTIICVSPELRSRSPEEQLKVISGFLTRPDPDERQQGLWPKFS